MNDEHEECCWEMDNLPCLWIAEDMPAEGLEVAWDMYCLNCHRYRDWTKKEFQEK